MRLPPARHSTPSVVKRRNYIHYVNTTNYTEYAAIMLHYVFESERTVFPVIWEHLYSDWIEASD